MTSILQYLQRSLFGLLMLAAPLLQAQDQGFIYGKVTTEDGDEYMGPIRWGKEEVYWTDTFNASKKDNDNLQYLSNDELEELEDRYYHRSSDLLDRIINVSWEYARDKEFVHEFSTAFGNIKMIRIRSSNRLELTLKNGEKVSLTGEGYNDVGTKLKVLDPEIGTIDLSWKNLAKIEFMPTPKQLEEKFGEPIYGTVYSEVGEFTGYIQWDHDERVSTDKLDGDTYDDDVSIEFGKIAAIERVGSSRSLVTLNSGRELELRGTNDVNDGNRGIIVTVENFGRVDIEWEDFDKVVFKPTSGSGPSYEAFGEPEKIEGTIYTDGGESYKGEIIYDLDEIYTFELLNGEDDDTKFMLPFKYVKEIEPRGYDKATIKMKDGGRLVLEDTQDVSDKNTGIVVKTAAQDLYIPWRDIEKIALN